MAKTYLMHKTGNRVGVADLPDWVNFDEHPPRSFQICWNGQGYGYPCSTSSVIPITKEVYDIIRSV
jgi:hypothetical protein